MASGGEREWRRVSSSWSATKLLLAFCLWPNSSQSVTTIRRLLTATKHICRNVKMFSSPSSKWEKATQRPRSFVLASTCEKSFSTTRENSIRKIKKHIHACKLKKQTRLSHLRQGSFRDSPRRWSSGIRGIVHHANVKNYDEQFRLFLSDIKNGGLGGGTKTHLTTDDRTVFPQCLCLR